MNLRNALVPVVSVLAVFCCLSADAYAQTIVRPSFYLVADNSTSMTASTGSGTNSCGYTRRRINDLACTVRNIADGVGDATFGMQIFNIGCRASPTPHYFGGTACGSVSCASAPGTLTHGSFPALPYSFYGCADTSTIAVPLDESQRMLMRAWGDGVWGSCTATPALGSLGGPELATTASDTGGAVRNNTPLGGNMRSAYAYLANQIPGSPSPFVNFNGTGAPDPFLSCRPMNVIMLTDGEENCSGANAAPANAANVGCMQVDLNGNGTWDDPIAATDPNPLLRGRFERNIDSNNDGDCYDMGEQRAFRTRTYSIGFGTGCRASHIEATAQYGGTPLHDVSCSSTDSYGYYATNEEEIAQAINDIIAASALNEVCNMLDDDCDGVVDNGYALGVACSAGVGACLRPGVTECDPSGLTTRCNAVAAAGTAENTVAACTNGLDDDCDGFTDCSDPDCAAVPACGGSCDTMPETCNGIDDNCNGLVDEGGITRPCGMDEGACMPGVEACETQVFPGSGSAIWSVCTGTGPTPERCDCIDNDCDGEIDDPDPGALCPGGQACILCGCSSMCVRSEFGIQCPGGSVLFFDDTDTCYCVPNRCEGVSCATGQACRSGVCEPVCAGVTCDAGESCRSGVCAPDPCASVTCAPGTVCDSATNLCVPNMCTADACVAGQVCEPTTGDCIADPCVFVECPSGTMCTGGECVTAAPLPDGGMARTDGGGDADVIPGGNHRVLASGGGGCSTTGAGTGDAGSLASFAALLLLSVFLLRRRFLRRSAGTLAALSVALLASGCDVDPFCVDCEDASMSMDGGNIPDYGTRDAPARDTQLPDSCTIGGTEVCNGFDDNCDGNIDEGFDFQNDPNNCSGCGIPCAPQHAFGVCALGACGFTTCESGFLDLNGEQDDGCEYGCVPSGEEICDGIDNDCDGIRDDGVIVPSGFSCLSIGACAGATPTCSMSNEGFTCNYNTTLVELNPATHQPVTVESRCDGYDNNCDGDVDESFTMLNAACDNGGVGACRMTGVHLCTADHMSTACNAPALGAGTAELCNGIDDDCDGLTDETASAPGTEPSYVTSAWIRYATNKWIMQYEASRPAATSTSQGMAGNRACSVAGVLPWTNVTYAQAQAACTAAGATLCNENSEWETACQGTMSCTWAFSSACSTYSTSACNGAEYATTDALLPTGSLTGCGAVVAGGTVYDMSGNAKEITIARSGGGIPLRGGSFTNDGWGLECDFDWTVVSSTYAFPTTGFRCCYSGTTPP
ncbi:MAG: hypothetical protein IPK60_03590 [Sandaracinaceae bacterium]|nr:hypothetical protein [Sandaracinaceae bacterium]